MVCKLIVISMVNYSSCCLCEILSLKFNFVMIGVKSGKMIKLILIYFRKKFMMKISSSKMFSVLYVFRLKNRMVFLIILLFLRFLNIILKIVVLIKIFKIMVEV